MQTEYHSARERKVNGQHRFFGHAKGSTGDHAVSMIDGEWACDCIGFLVHEHCKHVDHYRGEIEHG